MHIRVGIHKLYFKIAQEQLSRYSELDLEYGDLEVKGITEDELDDISGRMFDIFTQREQAAIVSVTFSAMCLEAFLYDYAAKHLGDKYVKDHLDKVALPSKLVLYPKLIVGADFDKSAEAFAKTKELTTLRHELVHFKSKRYDPTDGKSIDRHDQLHSKLAKGVKDSISTVRLVLAELDKMNGNDNFSKGLDWEA